MLSILPDFQQLKAELIFVVDLSGSDGIKVIGQVKKALMVNNASLQLC